MNIDTGIEAPHEVERKLFTGYDVEACFYDEQRVSYLKHAIFETVRPGDVVVDAGSGTGLLGLIAVLAGASTAYCVELNPEYLAVIMRHARANGLQDRIKIIQGDATEVELPEPVDVIISEMISAGFFYEPQLQALNHLHQFLKPGGRVVPQMMDNYVELIDAQDHVYDLRVDAEPRWRDLDGDHRLTTKAKYLSTDFTSSMSTEIATTSIVRALDSGIANAIRISYLIDFSNGTTGMDPVPALLNPQIIFLPSAIALVKGEYYSTSLSYTAGSSPSTCRVAVVPLESQPVSEIQLNN